MTGRYLAALDVIGINTVIMQHYQAMGVIRDHGLLESALLRPQMAAHYEAVDLVTQAALLMEGIARAHAFLDGNKRTALVAGIVFLYLNGGYIASAPTEFGQQLEALVIRAISLDTFIAWLREHLRTIE